MWQPGALVLDGRFRILQAAGVTAGTEDYVAEQVALARKVSLRVIRPELGVQVYWVDDPADTPRTDAIGDLVTNEHTRSAGQLPLFGGREVTSGFSGTYTSDEAHATGMSLVGKTSVLFEARMKFRSEL